MKTTRRYFSAAVAALALTPVLLSSQEVTVGGQIRPRYELRTQSGTEDAFISMRSRVHVSALLENDVRIFLQVQDVRLWGDETNTLFDFTADHLDMHQAFVEFNRPGDTQLQARIGRQEVNFGGQRLVGAVGWTQQARAFDGLRLSANSAAFRVDLVGFMLTDATSPTNGDDARFVGAYGQLKSAGPGALDIYALYNGADLADTDQATLGARWWGDAGGITFRAEGSFQTGTRAGSDVQAFMFGGRIGANVGQGNIALWYDYLSGDDDLTDADTRSFDTLFATNHIFYGFADLFLNIPVHTGQRGLQDVAVKGSYRFNDRTHFNLALHNFRLVESAGVDANLANEADVTFDYRYSSNASFQAGIAHIIGGDGLTDIGRNSDDMTWFYLMTNATF